jgi:hypothetical protein
MSTNAFIGIVNSDGSVYYSYLHYDGYDSYAGEKLRANYDTEEKVRQLLDHGAISILGDTIGEYHDFDKYVGKEVCTFYTRDRGEELRTGKTQSVKGFLQKDVEHKYLFKDGIWTTYS